MAKKELSIMNKIEKLQSLERRISGDSDWADLRRKINEFNPFDILGITTTEIRHSRVLIWLLNPKGNHGMENRILKRFIEWAGSKETENNSLTEKLEDFVVEGEVENIDIVAYSSKTVLCIENKIFSGEHDAGQTGEKQTKVYLERINRRFPDHRKLFLYISINGDEADHQDWVSMSYQDILNIIDTERKHKSKRDEADYFIDKYMETIKEHVLMNDERLNKLCNDIYAKYKEEFDIILEYRNSRPEELKKTIKKWLDKKKQEGILEYYEKYDSGSIIRFKMSEMSLLFSENDNNNVWDNSCYYYEINYRDISNNSLIQIDLVFSRTNLEKAGQDKMKKANDIRGSNKISSAYPHKKFGEIYCSDIFDDILVEDLLNQCLEKIESYVDEYNRTRVSQ